MDGFGYDWQQFDPDKVLLDPYAQAVLFPPGFDRSAACRSGTNAGKAPLGRICASNDVFDWGNDAPLRHDSDLVIYEMHVKGFTANANSGVNEGHRGKFAGVIDKIPYLIELGVTAVELMPVHQFDPSEGNYWGYNTLNFFAPHHLYACGASACEQKNEFREMVRKLHTAGIEVILDVVYNHTTEGNMQGPTFSFRGIDSSSYYMINKDNRQTPYANYTGCGNTLLAANQAVRRMVLDSLRYWVEEMHVDGFRFDLASVLTRNADGSLNSDDPPLFSQVAADPILNSVRLIAEEWDYNIYNNLRFPGQTWRLWNGRFRDAVQGFVKSDPNLVGEMVTRLYGSSDMFPDNLPDSFRPSQSVNYVVSHDGFTMYDLVSYNQKRNWPNGENNTDGPNDRSWNCGWEGDDHVPQVVIDLRKKQVKNFCSLLFLSNGTPMFRMGDEFLQTQQGNNNPYNQDNATIWLDWDRRQKNNDIFRFFKLWIDFRKRHPSLSRSIFWRGDVHWFGVNGGCDFSSESRAFAYCLLGGSEKDCDLYVMVNAFWQALTFQIQEGANGQWWRVVDTSLAKPQDIVDQGQEVQISSLQYSVQERSVVVLMRK
jgi:glycogen operon protein